MATTITANGINFPDGSAGSPSIGGSDTNTGLFTGADLIGFSTGGSERLRIDSSGKVGIGMTPSSGTGYILQLESGQAQTFMSFGNTGTGNGALNGLVVGNDTSRAYFTQRENQPIHIATNNVDRIAIDSSGKVGIGNTSPASFDDYADLLVVGTTSGNNGITIVAGSSNNSSIYFADGTSGGSQKNAGIVDYNHSTDSMRFATAANDAMRIHSTGVVQIVSERMAMGTSVTNGGTSDGNFCIEFTGNSRNGMKTRDTDNTGTVNHFVLVSGSAACGTITTSTGQAFFNNLSDYRSKENDVKITDGIEKIKLLRPIRFNYKVDKDTLCDGFFAHEVTPAVPTAVTGEKDAVDSEGKIDPQMLDSSKLIPLLVAAVQELTAKVETLEAA